SKIKNLLNVKRRLFRILCRKASNTAIFRVIWTRLRKCNVANLEDDPFFDDRSIRIIQTCLSGQKPTQIITPFERFLANNIKELQELEHSIDDGLIPVLRKSQDYATVKDAITFLLEAQSVGLLSDALEMLRISVQFEVHMTLESMYRTLEEAKEQNIPVSWAAGLMGTIDEESRLKDPRDNNNDSSFSIGEM